MASVWLVTGRTHGIQVSRAATLNTASNATAITVSRLVDKREQFFGNPLRDVLTLWPCTSVTTVREGSWQDSSRSAVR